MEDHVVTFLVKCCITSHGLVGVVRQFEVEADSKPAAKVLARERIGEDVNGVWFPTMATDQLLWIMG